MHLMSSLRRSVFGGMVVAGLVASPAALAQQDDPADTAQQLIDEGLTFLRDQQLEDGSWHGEQAPPAFTALALRAFVQEPGIDSETDFVDRGYASLLDVQMEDGGIYADLLANYNTAIALSALVAADDDRFDEAEKGAVEYLRQLQWMPGMISAEDESVRDKDDPWYGGWGYGGRSRGSGRPDLSNAQMTIEALHDAGLEPDDPAFEAAMTFVSRLQNSSETNDQPWAGDDGGFVYSPSDDRQGESMAGEFNSPAGERRLRSYGSMTYAGLKSMIYAGLSKEDPRVVAAWDWITGNWTLDENPGMRLGNPERAQNGLYYYYHTLARTLNEYDEPRIELADGTVIDWRVELIAKLDELQREDGSWSGDRRWREDNPLLVACYVVLALQEAREDLEQHPVETGE